MTTSQTIFPPSVTLLYKIAVCKFQSFWKKNRDLRRSQIDRIVARSVKPRYETNAAGIDFCKSSRNNELQFGLHALDFGQIHSSNEMRFSNKQTQELGGKIECMVEDLDLILAILQKGNSSRDRILTIEETQKVYMEIGWEIYLNSGYVESMPFAGLSS